MCWLASQALEPENVLKVARLGSSKIRAEEHGIPEKVMLSYLQGEIEGEAAVKNLPVAMLHRSRAIKKRVRQFKRS